MKIGIITFHNAINYGAVLQAFALQETLEELNVSCEILDYRCKKLNRIYNPLYIKSFSIRNILIGFVYLPFRLIKFLKFCNFRKRNLNLTKRKYDIKSIKDSNKEFDAFITGSDQVWNLGITDFDTTYMLDFVSENCKKNSYAASLGGLENISTNEMQIYKKNLQTFRNLSLREEKSAQFISNLLNRNIYTSIDPVFLLSEEKWKSFLGQRKVKKPYIFMYCLHESDVFKCAYNIKKQTNLNLVYIPNTLKKKIAAKGYFTASIEDFLNFICYADYVVTDSFHTAALSVIFKKNVKIVLNKHKQEFNLRLISLAEAMNITDSVIENVEDKFKICQNTNYNNFNELKGDLVNKSIQYLRKIVNNE